MIRAENLYLRYKSTQEPLWAVKGVCLQIKKGEFVVILGRSGSGKTSLLYLLSGLRAPTTGDVSFKGRSYSKLNAYEMSCLRKKSFGVVFQQHFLVEYLTINENICLGRAKTWYSKAGELLEKLDLKGKENLFPNQVSHGQRQRVAIIRSLIHMPQMIFADEPTASVDSKLARRICYLFKWYCKKGNSCIMATHDTKLMQYADRIYEINDGIITAV